MKVLLAFILSCSTLFADVLDLSTEEREWIKNNKQVFFTGDPNWLPFEAFNNKGNYIGIVAEHLDIIENSSGLKFVPLATKDWRESLKMATERKVSVISGDRADKTLNINYKPIDPYIISPIVIIMSHDAHYVEDLHKLKDKKIAIIKDYGYTADIFKYYPNISFTEVESIQEGLSGVSNGDFDAMLASMALTRFMITQMGLKNITIVGKTPVVMEVTLFVNKKEPILYDIINKSVHSIPVEKHQSILDKWYTLSDAKTTSLRWAWLTILITLSLLISIAIAYKNLSNRKKLYKYALLGSSDALWNWNIKKDKIFFSPRFKEILGFEDEDCLCSYDLWIKRIHPDDRKMIIDLVQKNTEGKTDIFITEYRMEHKDGSWRWIRTRAKTLFGRNNEAKRMDGICSDITTEKTLTLELFKSKKLLNAIIDNIPLRVFWKDTEGRLMGYNKLFSQDIGSNTGHEYIGKNDFDMPWQANAQQHIDDDQEVIRSKQARLNYEEKRSTTEKNDRWLAISKVPLLDEENNVFGILETYNDITKQKMHQIENENNTKRLESAQEIGHLGSWEWNILSGKLVWSDEVYRIFGEEPQSFSATYEAFKTYIPSEYHDGLENAISNAIRDKKPYEFVHEIRRKDGTMRLVREAGYVRFNVKGEATSMLGTVLDINTLVEAKSTQRENKELTELLHKFDENVIASNTDLKGIITYASEAFCRTSGYSHEELLGSPQSIVRHPDTPNETFRSLWSTIQAGKIWHGEIKNIRKNGASYWVETTVSPTFDEHNNITGYSSIRRNITHEKQIENLHYALEKKSTQLLTLNKELEKRIKTAVEESKHKDHMLAQQSKLASMGEMIGNIAHQWRQPLNALSLLLQKQQIFFERGLLTAESLEESVAKGTSLITKMSTTIDDFRDFFKPNKLKADFDIKDAIDGTLELIDASLYNQNILLDMNVEPGHIVHGYKNEFSQVVLNLINNAKDVLIASSNQEGKIIIRSFMQGKDIYIEVADNAGGIREDVIGHIFEPYFTTKEEGKGTGIGLYMSKMIIEGNMHGKLTVRNNDDGAVFTISLRTK